MTLYEINEQILSLADPETGEITDFDALETLEIARDEKRENIACWIKNLSAEAADIRAEEIALAERRHKKEAKIEKLTAYLDADLGGERFETAKCAVGYRKSSKVEFDDEAAFLQGLIKANKTEYLANKITIDRAAVTAAIKAGKKLAGAQLVERRNIQIK